MLVKKGQNNKIINLHDKTVIYTSRFVYTPISKNVVGENGEWLLSNGNCTPERDCDFHIWYAKTMSSSRGAELILPYERPTGPGLT